MIDTALYFGKMEELRLRNHAAKSTSLSGKILGKHSFPLFSIFLREFKPVYKDNRFQRIICLGFINITSIIILASWCNSTQSMGLLSYTYLTVFDILCLFICALSIWVEQKKPNSQYTYGYERVEVLAVFVSTTFSCTSSFFIIKKSIGRWIQQTQIHTGRLFPGIILAFFCHMLITYCMKNKGLNLVVCASDSSWLQNRMTSVNQSLTHIVPGYSSSSPPRINPFTLLGCAAGGTLILALFFIDIYNCHSADAMAGIFISILNFITMYPISAYSAKILLQGTPPHVSDLLDKCLREATTFDGVLEFRNEHFWLLGFDKIIGTIHVRIRRDANEQIVLSHLLNKLSSLVSDLTIQVFKDEWAWSSSTRQILNDSFMKFPPVQDSYALSTGATAAAGSFKETVVSSNTSAVSTTYSYPNMKSLQQPQPQQSHSYSTIPLPPSLGASKSSPKIQNVSINMSGTDLVPKTVSPSTGEQSKIYQTPYVQTSTSSSKYNRELCINPTFSSSPNYMIHATNEACLKFYLRLNRYPKVYDVK